MYVLNCGILDFSLKHIGKCWRECEIWINSGVSQVWIGYGYMLRSLQGNTKRLFSLPALSKFSGNLCIPIGKERLVQVVFQYVSVHLQKIFQVFLIFSMKPFFFSNPYEQPFHKNGILALDWSTYIWMCWIFERSFITHISFHPSENLFAHI